MNTPTSTARRTPTVMRMTERILTMNTSTMTAATRRHLMPRVKGSGALGPVRSLRLPVAIDKWFEERLRDDPNVPASDLLLQLLHGGLRLRPGYMLRHREELERLEKSDDVAKHEGYVDALRDSFGEFYLQHLRAWIEAEVDLENKHKNVLCDLFRDVNRFPKNGKESEQ